MPPDKPFMLFPEAASTTASRVDHVMFFVMGVCAFFLIVILVLIVVFSLKYRRRSENDIPPISQGSHVWVEIGWSVFPFGLLMIMFCLGTSLYVDIKRPLSDSGALVINVIGKQWMWKLQHPGGQREIDELHVPAGQPVKLVLTSQDVIHDFYVPEFRIKQDVLPGSYVTEWFQATAPGEYHLFCAEYCGTDHSRMVGRIVVMRPEDYQRWLSGTMPSESPVQSGSRLFTLYGCSQCHGQTAPTLAGLFGQQVRLSDGSTAVADENYIRESILNPPAKIVAGFPALMPSFRQQLSEEQVADLVAYIKSLSPVPQAPLPVTNMPPARETSQ